VGWGAAMSESKRTRNQKKLFAILTELDCQLQLLGVRGDWGSSGEAYFAAETLVAGLLFISRLDDAPKNLLLSSAKDLVEIAERRMRRREPEIITLAELVERAEHNATLFKKLFEQYCEGCK
jgi:hypothetical protein